MIECVRGGIVTTGGAGDDGFGVGEDGVRVGFVVVGIVGIEDFGKVDIDTGVGEGGVGVACVD